MGASSWMSSPGGGLCQVVEGMVRLQALLPGVYCGDVVPQALLTVGASGKVCVYVTQMALQVGHISMLPAASVRCQE